MKKDVAPQAVTHLSTNHGRRCLTWAIGREPLLSTWYGKRQPLSKLIVHFTLGCTVLARMSDTGRNRAGLSNAGVTYLGHKLFRFAINTTNPGLFQIRCQYILVRRAKMYWHSVWKSPVLSNLGQVWSTFWPNLASLSTVQWFALKKYITYQIDWVIKKIKCIYQGGQLWCVM